MSCRSAGFQPRPNRLRSENQIAGQAPGVSAESVVPSTQRERGACCTSATRRLLLASSNLVPILVYRRSRKVLDSDFRPAVTRAAWQHRYERESKPTDLIPAKESELAQHVRCAF